MVSIFNQCATGSAGVPPEFGGRSKSSEKKLGNKNNQNP
jgi:hypothetical protein